VLAQFTALRVPTAIPISWGRGPGLAAAPGGCQRFEGITRETFARTAPEVPRVVVELSFLRRRFFAGFTAGLPPLEPFAGLQRLWHYCLCGGFGVGSGRAGGRQRLAAGLAAGGGTCVVGWGLR